MDEHGAVLLADGPLLVLPMVGHRRGQNITRDLGRDAARTQVAEGRPFGRDAATDVLSTVANTSRLQVTDAAWMDVGALTLEAWIFVTDVGTTDPRIMARQDLNAGPSANSFDFLYGTSGELSAGYFTGSTSRYFASSGGVIVENRWHHVAATLGDGTSRLYVDGIEVATSATSGAVNSTSNAIWIGNVFQGSTSFALGLPGSMAWVAIYPSKLSAAAIARHHAAGRKAFDFPPIYLPTVAPPEGVVAPALGTVDVTGFDPTVSQTQTVEPELGAVAVTGFDPELAQTQILEPELGVVDVTGFDPIVQVPLVVPLGAVAVTGFAPSVAQRLFAELGVVAVTGFTPTVDQDPLAAELAIAIYVEGISIEAWTEEPDRTDPSATVIGL